MSDAVLIAIMNMVSRVGIDATIVFLENRGASIDDAIAALKMASEKKLSDYVKEDAATRVLPTTQAPPPVA